MHDIGKLEVSWPLLNRVRPLGPLQEERLRAHVLAGGRILEDLGFPMTARLVEEHHERADGQGYPYGTRYQTLSGAFLALAESLVAMSQPSRACPNPPPVLDNAQWCLREGVRRFQPQAAAALFLAVESGILLPFQVAVAAISPPMLFTYHVQRRGEMSEWPKEHAWKACELERVPGVRIPVSPPIFSATYETCPRHFSKAVPHSQVQLKCNFELWKLASKRLWSLVQMLMTTSFRDCARFTTTHALDATSKTLHTLSV